MCLKELKKKDVKDMNQSEAIVYGASLVADALKEMAKIQRETLEISRAMAEGAGTMMKQMADSMTDLEEGEAWKKSEDYEDDE